MINFPHNAYLNPATVTRCGAADNHIVDSTSTIAFSTHHASQNSAELSIIKTDPKNHRLIVRQSHGGRLATIISALALLYSSHSFYEAVLQASELAAYVPPRIAFTDPDQPTSSFEVLTIPVTLANDGARTGTVLSLNLTA